MGKFDPKAYECLFVGYSTTSKAYRVYHQDARIIEESIHVTFCDTNLVQSILEDVDAGNQAQKEDENAQNHGKENSGQAEPETANDDNSRDNSILSHESEGNPTASSAQNPLVTESTSKSTRPRE